MFPVPAAINRGGAGEYALLIEALYAGDWGYRDIEGGSITPSIYVLPGGSTADITRFGSAGASELRLAFNPADLTLYGFNSFDVTIFGETRNGTYEAGDKQGYRVSWPDIRSLLMAESGRTIPVNIVGVL